MPADVHGATNTMMSGPVRHRSLFLSDFHLGSVTCQAERLYWFLRQNTADQIYLVGDILDGGTIKRWPLYHDLVLATLASHLRHGAKVVYVPGNHDAFLRAHYGAYGSFRIARRTKHVCVDGRILLITHGDETDCIRLGRLLYLIICFERNTGLSMWNWVRKLFGGWIVRHVSEFETKMRRVARRRHDGVICGHVHEPAITGDYMNCGDWVFHCTAIAEHHDGRFELLHG